MDISTPLLDRLSASIEHSSQTAAKAAVLPQVLAASVTCIGSTIVGFSLGYSSPAIPQLKDAGILDTEEKVSWFGSLIAVGGILGGPIAGLLLEKIGRKSTVMACCVPFSIAWFMTTLGKNFIILFVARIILGIGVGMASVSSPVYIGEIASKDLRGTLCTGIQLSVALGIFLAYGLGFLLASWQWLALVGAAMSGVLIVLMLFVPETPHWLLSRQDSVGALKSLEWLRGPNMHVQQECHEILQNLEVSHSTMTVGDLKAPDVYKPLFISLGLMFFQQMSGVNAVIFYAETIFIEAGFELDARIAALIVGAVQVVATAVACFLMDRAGRRILLIVAGILMCLSCVALGAYYYRDIKSLNWLPLASLNVYLIAFSIGWGPIPWFILGEIFSIRAKGLSSSLSSTLNWILAFIITKEFSELETKFTRYGTFWLFGGMILSGVIFVIIFLPETKGKSLEEIQQHFGSRPRTISITAEQERVPLLQERGNH